MKATGEFTVASWNQADLDGVWDGKQVMKIDAEFEVSGEISGSIIVAYLMYYSQADEADPHNGTAQYTGYLAFTGNVAGKEGSFILQDCGIYENSAPSSVLTVINNSGKGDLTGLSGTGKYFARDGKMVIELEYALAYGW